MLILMTDSDTLWLYVWAILLADDDCTKAFQKAQMKGEGKLITLD